jgi:hypothetical protein
VSEEHTASIFKVEEYAIMIQEKQGAFSELHGVTTQRSALFIPLVLPQLS